MTITLSSATLPVFQTALTNLGHCLKKAETNAMARSFSPEVLVGLRLAPDMLPLASQVRIACDAAKNGTARVSGMEAPTFADDETTFAQLQERIAKTLAWLATVPTDAFDGREAQEVTFPIGKEATRTMKAEAYLKHWSIPNVYFHVTTVYALLRQAGVDLGKADFLVGAQAAA
ncbi:hypothetical protein LPB72_21015 [Hydrogenophaga crassostreae]|uniref:DUF1993 domain-containing protein n=1 Tax=Hydrogenophaga crassostreae TaxID=1763535 RepID=A0A167GI31_9BURK|nr:DUF1993 domain-containing protein [Hydrogenophaga crassostreae]AOW15022.1 hypothetical protein LPB072_21630 [Hydrogenophaga crassostreae]OAD39475.1 hypothetical protein LPB72_21015 [Hydrogenophaga crassostreae]